MQWFGESYDDVNTIAIGPDHDNLRRHYLEIANHLGYTCTGEYCHPNSQNNCHSATYMTRVDVSTKFNECSACLQFTVRSSMV